jgi:hypothetical protein
MSLASAVVLLQTALSLLTLVNANPSLPQSMRDDAQQVAQQAIAQATTAIAAQSNATAYNDTSEKTNKGGSISSEVLANKVTCAAYKDKVQQDTYKGGYQYDLPAIYKIIYSKSLNTCLIERYDIYPANGTTAESEALRIDDALTGGNVWTSAIYSPALKYWDAESILDQQSTLYQ